MYLTKRHRRWWAFHDIPAALRATIGRGARFSANLDTTDRKTAENRAAALAIQWHRQIETARRLSDGREGDDAEWWNLQLSTASESEKEQIRERIKEEAQEIALADVDPFDPTMEGYANHEAATRFYRVATGGMVRFDAHVDDWVKTLRNEPKTVDMKRSNVLKFARAFPYVQDVRRKEVQQWIASQVDTERKSPATIQRMLSELRGYWSYLISVEDAAEDVLPFDKLTLPKPSSKEAQQNSRRAFTPKEVVGLLREATKRGDSTLADLIRLAMWTGARIEELCALKVENASPSRLIIDDAKTRAGVREIPVHKKLAETVKRLKRSSADGYLLSGLTPDKYGDRSPAIGKRFGRMKRGLEFGSQHVFHSIRKTVITLLENAGVTENVTMDIAGHEKPTITYGHYSEGNTLAVMRQAIAKLEYPA